MTTLNLLDVAGELKCYSPAAPNPFLSEADLIYTEVFRRNTYLRRLRPLPPDPVVVDAGANIGIFTLFVKRHYPGARIIAIEPIPYTAAALRANIRLYRLSGVTVHAEGLAARAETRSFHYFPSMPGNSTVHLAGKLKDREVIAAHVDPVLLDQVYRHEEITVPVRPLSAILAESVPPDAAIDLVKMDIEGGEEEALAGIDEPDWPRIRQMALEVHETRHTLDRVVDRLRSRDFTVTVQDPADTPPGIDNRMVYAGRR
ncbi:MAG TPA: FkbM family methyltransferase [Actinoplanes sp.]|nr:FkbM family methyltransferase [Actinoplanes sp.]